MLVGILSLVVLHHNGEVSSNERTVAAISTELQARQAGAAPLAFANVSDQALSARLTAAGKDVPFTFDVVKIADAQRVDDTSKGAAPWDWSAARWLFLAFAVAFAVKVPLFPLHTWLPDAHTEAPTAGSVILAGVMLKLGTYGFLRFGLYLFPKAAVWFAPGFVTLGVIGILYGAIVAAMQKDLKRLVAYSSVAHLGFIALGTFAITTQGLQGSVLQMVIHGLSTSALFLLVGIIYERCHTREIAKLGGLQKSAPLLAAVFMLVMMSSIGLPGLNGFVGEFLILIGSFLTRRWWAIMGAAGVILAAVYLLWAYQRVFHGEPVESTADARDLDWRDLLVMAPLVGLIVFIGVYPKPVLDRIEPSVDALVHHVERHDPSFHQPDVATTGSPSGEQAKKQEGAGG
jgi:NADH-quinone oxidoreductase subunit M